MSVFFDLCPCLWAGLTRAGEGRPWRAFLILLAWILTTPVWAQGALPSGQSVSELDRAVEVQGDGRHWLVLRYVAPRIARDGGDLSYEAVLPDLDALCATSGLQIAAEVGPIDQIVIVLLDQPVERGVSDPGVTQYISAYLPTADGCEWQ